MTFAKAICFVIATDPLDLEASVTCLAGTSPSIQRQTDIENDSGKKYALRWLVSTDFDLTSRSMSP